MREKKFKNKNGITLIALIITIIVMLILVAVTITIAVNGGLFNYAKKASVDTNTRMAEEQMLADGKVHIDNVWYASIDDYINSGEGFSDYYTETTEYKENNVTVAYIPAGFAVGVTSGINTVAGGLVIQDKDGNQFVWIPVDAETAEEFEDLRTSSGNYNEPFTNAEEWETEEYDEMVASVVEHGGFYIGRYEAGIPTTENYRVYNENGTDTSKVVVQRDCYPYNYVGWGASMTDYTSTVTSEYDNDDINGNYVYDDEWNVGNGAVYLSKNMYKNSSSVTSTLVYGVQWDAMLTFLEKTSETDSTSWGNYYNNTGNTWNITRSTAKYSEDYGNHWASAPKTKANNQSILLTTGANDNFKAKNIYDVAGNLDEWTMEAYSTSYLVARGGVYDDNGSSYPASHRYSYDPTYCEHYLGFRPALYVR